MSAEYDQMVDQLRFELGREQQKADEMQTIAEGLQRLLERQKLVAAYPAARQALEQGAINEEQAILEKQLPPPLSSFHSTAIAFKLIEEPTMPPVFSKFVTQVAHQLDLTRPDAGEREALGRAVRKVWMDWAREQADPKSSWLTPWEELSEPMREVDRRIGVAIANVIMSTAQRVVMRQSERFAAELLRWNRRSMKLKGRN